MKLPAPLAAALLCAALLCAAMFCAAGQAHAVDFGGGLSRAAMGVLDIIFLCVAGYVVWRIVSRLRNQNREDDGQPPTYDADSRADDDDAPGPDPRDMRSRRAQAAWDYLTGDPAPSLHPREEHPLDAPGTFNEREFLTGAKIMYRRILESWGGRDLADLRQFCAPDMMRRFEEMAGKNPAKQQVAVMLVDARVEDLKRTNTSTCATVSYEATVADAGAEGGSRKASEVWRFCRDETLTDAKWLLESMERPQ